jgi:hypothetical protein
MGRQHRTESIQRRKRFIRITRRTTNTSCTSHHQVLSTSCDAPTTPATHINNPLNSILDKLSHRSVLASHVWSYARQDHQHPPTYSCEFACMVCTRPSRVQCTECGGGVHASCSAYPHMVTPRLVQDGTYLESMCNPCYTLLQAAIESGPTCKLCGERNAASTFEGMRCERCGHWYHEICRDVSIVRICDSHGIGNEDACTTGEHGRCRSGAWVTMCTTCVDMC